MAKHSRHIKQLTKGAENDMNENQMRMLLEAIQQATMEGNHAKFARELAACGLTVLNASRVEAETAWADIERMVKERPDAGRAR